MLNRFVVEPSELSERLRAVGVNVLTSTCALRIEATGVAVVGPDSEAILEADSVVVAVGIEPNKELAEELRCLVETRVVGDAVRPGRIHDAVHSAQQAALAL